MLAAAACMLQQRSELSEAKQYKTMLQRHPVRRQHHSKYRIPPDPQRWRQVSNPPVASNQHRSPHARSVSCYTYPETFPFIKCWEKGRTPQFGADDRQQGHHNTQGSSSSNSLSLCIGVTVSPDAWKNSSATPTQCYSLLAVAADIHCLHGGAL